MGNHAAFLHLYPQKKPRDARLLFYLSLPRVFPLPEEGYETAAFLVIGGRSQIAPTATDTPFVIVGEAFRLPPLIEKSREGGPLPYNGGRAFPSP